MFVDDAGYPSWLQLTPYPTSRDNTGKKSPSSTTVPELFQIARMVSFKLWDGFHNVFSSCKSHMASLPERDRNRVYISSGVDDFNLNRVDGSVTTRSAVGADDVAKDISILEFLVKRALQIPPILKDLRCHPRSLSSKAHATVVWPPSAREGSSATAVSAATVVRDVKPDIGLYENSGNGEILQLAVEAKRPLLTFDSLKIRAPSRSKLRTTRQKKVEDKSGALHETLENLFLRVRTDWSGLNPNEKAVALSVAQAIVYGIHTNSGCCVLTTFDQTFVMQIKISRIGFSRRWRMQVHVSHLYSSKVLFCVLVASIKYVFSRTFDSNWQLRLRLMQHLDPQAKGPDSRSSKKSPSGKRSGMTNVGTERQKKKASGSGSKQKSSSRCDPLWIYPVAEAYEIDSAACYERDSEESSDMETAKRPFLEIDPEIVYSVMVSNLGYITQGYNKTMRSTFNGAAVVVKYFSSLDERREVPRIEHELKMHEYLMQKCSKGDYGDFVARVMAYGELESYGLVLILEYVGHSVAVDSGRFKVGSEFVEDVGALSEAAFESLTRLHCLGVSHGDIALRNLRAMRLEDGAWKVWLVDLGFAETVENGEKLEQDAMELRALFAV